MQGATSRWFSSQLLPPPQSPCTHQGATSLEKRVTGRAPSPPGQSRSRGSDAPAPPQADRVQIPQEVPGLVESDDFISVSHTTLACGYTAWSAFPGHSGYCYPHLTMCFQLSSSRAVGR